MALRRFASSILSAAGLACADATVVGDALVESNLRGVDGHGVLRLVQYVESIRGGGINVAPRVRVIKQGGATALVDADGGYGFAPAFLAMDTAVVLAEQFGVGAVGVSNSHHFGIAVLYALRATDSGFIGLATTNTKAVMPAPGGLRPVIGNNPIAIAVPRESALPIAVDVALSEVSWGKISLAASDGSHIPEGWAFDGHGAPTTDPAVALKSNMLVPIGGHKGFALGVLLELVAGALTGSPVGPAADGHSTRSGGCGHLLIAINPEHFAGFQPFRTQVEELVEVLRTTPRLDGSRRELPGERGFEIRRERLECGIPISGELRLTLHHLATELGVLAL